MEPADDMDEWRAQVVQALWVESRLFSKLGSMFGAK